MKMSKAFPIKLGIYTVVFIYVLCDLFVFNGPLKKAVDDKSGKNRNHIVQKMQEEKVAAYVYRHPIYLSQVDYFVAEWFRARGFRDDEVSPELLRVTRGKALDYLIEDTLFRIKAELNEERFPVDQEQVDKSLHKLTQRFCSTKQKSQAEKAMGIEGDKELSLRLTAMRQQEIYLEQLLTESLSIQDNHLKEYYEENKKRFVISERVSARHIFLAHLEHPDDGEQRIKEIATRLKKGEHFSTLASAYSEDEQTKSEGGELGFIKEDRCQPALRPFLFGEKQITPEEAHIVHSKLGYHLIMLNEIIPAEQLSFESVREEIGRAMLAFETPGKLIELRQRLRLEAGTIYRHRDTTKDVVNVEERAYKIERFNEIFETPYSM